MLDAPFLNRFHDLVFGHELGQGSFSSVKYARQITKGKSRSDWPEFAVKIISTTKIEVRQTYLSQGLAFDGHRYEQGKHSRLVQLTGHESGF